MKRHLSIDHAAEIFRAHLGDRKAQEAVSVEEMIEFAPAAVFSRFLEINQIETHEGAIDERRG